MQTWQQRIRIDTRGRGNLELTDRINRMVTESGIRTGICHLLLQHTSASLMLCENADPTVRQDLESFMSRLAPDGDPGYRHSLEGPDDMPAHIRAILTKMDLSLPVTSGRLALGTWQGIYLWEHRFEPHRRHLVVTLQGEG